MSDVNDKTVDDLQTLADAIALKITGPMIVFVRPRKPLSTEETIRLEEELNGLPLPAHLGKIVLVPSMFDIMAAGDVELERIGLRRIT